MNHIRDVHKTNSDDNKVRVLANSFQKLFLPCTPCNENEPQIRSCSKDPVTRYLKSLASGSRPRDYNNIPGDLASDENSPNNLQPRSRSTINDLDDESVLKSPYVTKLDDRAIPSTLAISGGKELADEFLKRGKPNSYPVWHSVHIMVDKADIISPELSNEPIGQKIDIQLKHEINSGFDMDPSDIEMGTSYDNSLSLHKRITMKSRPHRMKKAWLRESHNFWSVYAILRSVTTNYHSAIAAPSLV